MSEEGTNLPGDVQPTAQMPAVGEQPASEALPAPAAAPTGASGGPPQFSRKALVGGILATAFILIGVATAIWLFFLQDASIKIPDLIGMTLERAQDELEDMGFEVGDVSYVITEASVATSGTVLAQTPMPGVEADEGASVDLVIATGGSGMASVDETAPIAVQPEPLPAPAPEPEPEPEPVPPAEPTGRWVSIVAEEGVGDWANPAFRTTSVNLKLTITLESPSGGEWSVLLRESGSGDAAEVFGYDTLIHDTVTKTTEFEMVPGYYHVQIIGPDDGIWSFKLYEYR